MYESMNIVDINKIYFHSNSSNILVDIRDKYEYLLSHINNAINIPYNFLSLLPENYLDKNNTYYFYCDNGKKSKELCESLNKIGYKTIDLVGGYNTYLDNKEVF